MIIKVNEFYKLKNSYIQVLSITKADNTKVESLNSYDMYFSASVQFYLNGVLQSTHVGALEEIPKVVKNVEAEKFWEVKKLGETLEKMFPGQQADEFQLAINYAVSLPEELVEVPVDRFVMVHEGERDGDDWIWYLKANKLDWILVAGCDYTGWDCQASGRWYKLC